MNPGIYLGMDRAEYDALPLYNQTSLKKWIELSDLPSEFAYWREHSKDDGDKECLLIGSALDCFVLESSKIEARFAIAPKCDRRTKAGKEIWSEFQDTVNSRQVLTAEQAVRVSVMSMMLETAESTRGIFTNCHKAVMIANIFGFDCKGEVDLWEEKTEHIWDLKALRDVSPRGFGKAFCDFGYDIQATFYLALARELKFDKRVFNFVCVKNEPPYTVQVHSFSPFDNEEHGIIAAQATRKITSAIKELDHRIKTDSWKDDQDWRLIDIPTWRLRQAKYEMEAA